MAYKEAGTYVRPTHMNARKNARRAAEKKHPGEPMAWCGGKLCFLSNGFVVPGTPVLPKPHRKAIGFEASGAQRLAVIPSFGASREFGEGGFYGFHPSKKTDSATTFYDHERKHGAANDRDRSRSSHRPESYVSGGGDYEGGYRGGRS
ncbi:MAG: hypothetical protein JWM46_717 [Candidatus Kaiserbacteria bacterium]|nr:hypothetical protein [Candidatus Kaiserbacteria bacterium]